MDVFISILFLCFIVGLGYLNRFGKSKSGNVWKFFSTFSQALFLFLILSMIAAVFNQKLTILMGIFCILFWVLIRFIGYGIAGVFLRRREKKK